MKLGGLADGYAYGLPGEQGLRTKYDIPDDPEEEKRFHKALCNGGRANAKCLFSRLVAVLSEDFIHHDFTLNIHSGMIADSKNGIEPRVTDTSAELIDAAVDNPEVTVRFVRPPMLEGETS